VTRTPGAMHVETSRSRRMLRDGTERTYERHLLRRSFRDGGKIRKKTLANLSYLPPEAIAAIRAVLAGKTLIDADAAFEIARSLPRGRAEKSSAYSPSGQRADDAGSSSANVSATQATVVYGTSIWWPATEMTAGLGSPGFIQGLIGLSNGPGNGWPAFIRSQLSCDVYTVAGHQVVGEIDAIKITASSGFLTLLVNPATYLPVQLTIGPLQMHFRWLPPTLANLALLKTSVPAGFRQIPPPAEK
jgi:hypothetical protein